MTKSPHRGTIKHGSMTIPPDCRHRCSLMAVLCVSLTLVSIRTKFPTAETDYTRQVSRFLQPRLDMLESRPMFYIYL